LVEILSAKWKADSLKTGDELDSDLLLGANVDRYDLGALRNQELQFSSVGMGDYPAAPCQVLAGNLTDKSKLVHAATQCICNSNSYTANLASSASTLRGSLSK